MREEAEDSEDSAAEEHHYEQDSAEQIEQEIA